MSKLSKAEIEKIFKEKGFTLIDYSQYQNLESLIDFECKNGHKITDKLKNIRKPKYVCPKCEGGTYKMRKDGRPPQKESFRVIGMDQATHKIGISVFDGNNLVYYTVLNFESDVLEERLAHIYKAMTETIIPEWEPDFVVLEDIQLQGTQYTAFKALAMLLGMMVAILETHGIAYDIVKSSVWRSTFSIRGKTRQNQKIQAMKKVKDMYDIVVTDDAAEGILLGKHAVKKLNAKKRKRVF